MTDIRANSVPSDNSDLIGQLFVNGEDGVTRYRVTKVDSEFPELVHWENTLTGREGCALAVFVRPYLVGSESSACAS